MHTTVVTEEQLEALADKLDRFEGVLDADDWIALLTVFELAAEALERRVDDELEVVGFAQQSFTVGLQVGVPSTLPSPGDGLRTSLKGAGKGKGGKGTTQPYLQVTLHDCIISSY